MQSRHIHRIYITQLYCHKVMTYMNYTVHVYMTTRILTPDQLTHVDHLVHTLTETHISVDTSTTGSGKTVTSLEVAVRLIEMSRSKAEVGHASQEHLNISEHPIVIAPRFLHAQWLQVTTDLFPELCIQLESSDSIRTPQTKHVLMIVDECHYFKNMSKRHHRLIQCMASCQYVLLMSATPLDHPRHLAVVNRLVKRLDSISNHTINEYVFHMKYTPPQQCLTYLYHVRMSEHDIAMYDKGYRKLLSAPHIRGDEALGNPSVFSGAYTKGLQQMHASLLPYLIQLTREYLTRAGKLIVVVRFREHAADLWHEFPHGLLLTGDTHIVERNAVMKLFQRPDMKYPLLIISSVGMTGINLDDTHGSYPRYILSLPIPTATEYMQLMGRVNRRFTKSTPTCIFVQPMRKKTLVQNMLTDRVQVLTSLFRATPPKVYHKVHTCKCYVPNIESCSVELLRLISSFRCECNALLI
jgi:superfamily II DNA or RNA helicase